MTHSSQPPTGHRRISLSKWKEIEKIVSPEIENKPSPQRNTTEESQSTARDAKIAKKAQDRAGPTLPTP